MTTLQQQTVGYKRVWLGGEAHPQALLVQTLGRHEQATLAHELERIGQLTRRPFLMAAFDIADWDLELTPWADPAVSRRKDVGTGAEATLHYITRELLPALEALPVVLGGYSLGGLFALWAASQTDRFAAVAACSPSLWIRQWMPWAEAHPLQAKTAYLSLGDREEKVRNEAIRRVGDCLRAEHQLLQATLGPRRTILHWEQGNHFTDADGRLARGFAWCLDQLDA